MADRQRRLFAAELQVLRNEPDRGKRKNLVAVANLGPAVDDAGGADAAVAADADVLADDGVRSDDGAGADLCAPWTIALESIVTPGHRRCIPRIALIDDAIGHERHHQLGLGNNRFTDRGDRMRPRQFAAASAERHFEAQPVARHYLPPELRIVDATEVGMARRLAVRSLHQEQRRDLRQRLDHEHARHQRRAGKVSLEEIFVDGDVLDGDEPFAGLVLGYRIDERRRVPVAQPVDGFGNVRGAQAESYQVQAVQVVQQVQQVQEVRRLMRTS